MEKRDGDFLGTPGSLFLPQPGPQDDGNLLVQVIHHILNEHGQIVPGVVDPVGFIPGEAGVDDPDQLADHINDHFLVRLLEGVQSVDSPAVAVVQQNAVHNTLNALLNGCHFHPSNATSLTQETPPVNELTGASCESLFSCPHRPVLIGNEHNVGNDRKEPP